MGRGRWAGGEGEGEKIAPWFLRHAPSRLPSTSQYVTFSALSLRTVSANDAPIAPPQPGCPWCPSSSPPPPPGCPPLTPATTSLHSGCPGCSRSPPPRPSRRRRSPPPLPTRGWRGCGRGPRARRDRQRSPILSKVPIAWIPSVFPASVRPDSAIRSSGDVGKADIRFCHSAHNQRARSARATAGAGMQRERTMFFLFFFV